MESIKGFLSTIWKYWKKFGEFMGNLIGRLFLMLFYVTVVLPFGIGARLFSDALDIKSRQKQPEWLKREPVASTIEASYNQF